MIGEERMAAVSALVSDYQFGYTEVGSTMDLKEFNAIINRPKNLRYEYFVKKAAATEIIWGLYDEGWAMTTDSEGLPLLPLWPKSEFAQHSALGNWSGCSGRPLDLLAFMDKILPRLAEDGVRLSVFPNNIDSEIADADLLLVDLQSALKK
ncbi:hypothetical protein B9G55_11995 [Saccharibacillus sp. O16]|nr:hypothetical protein B9G55_11995 [Saccharibacillus sp. O16]